MKKIVTVFIPVFFMLIFTPVFMNVIFKGQNENYYDYHKIFTYYSNKKLLLFGIVFGCLLLMVLFFLRKIPTNKFTVWFTILFSGAVCVGLYFINFFISKNIIFLSLWDCGMVKNSTLWLYNGGEIGYGEYYKVFPNNVTIIWLFYKLYGWASGMKNYPYNPDIIWIQFQCVMYSLSVFFSVMTVFVITRKWQPALMGLLIITAFIGLTPWEMIPYTDGISIALPVLLLFLYVSYYRIKGWIGCIFLFLIGFVGICGSTFKATVLIAFIAIAAMELIRWCSETGTVRKKILSFFLILFSAGTGIVFASFCRERMYQTVGYSKDPDWEITWEHYLYTGLNEEFTGASCGDAYQLIHNLYPMHVSDRNKIALRMAIDRMKEKGFYGTLNFYFRKQTMNFNDGTFSWFKDGGDRFHAKDYEYVFDSPYREQLQNFYWNDGADYYIFTTWSQFLWLFFLGGVLLETMFSAINSFDGKHEKDLFQRDTMILMLIGIFLFIMLFEARARYLLIFTPVFAAAGMIGVYDCFVFLMERLKRSMD